MKTAREILKSVYQAGLYHSKEKDVDIALKELRELAPKKMKIKYGDEEYPAGWNACLKAVLEVLK